MEYSADGTLIVRDKERNKIGARRRAQPVASNSEGKHPEVLQAHEYNE